MGKTIIQIGNRPYEFELEVWAEGSAIRVVNVVANGTVADNAKVKKQVRETRIIGRTRRGDVLRRSESTTNRG